MTLKHKAHDILTNIEKSSYQHINNKYISNQEYVEKELKDLRNETINECYTKIIECFPVLTCVTTLSICLSQLKE